MRWNNSGRPAEQAATIQDLDQKVRHPGPVSARMIRTQWWRWPNAAKIPWVQMFHLDRRISNFVAATARVLQFDSGHFFKTAEPTATMVFLLRRAAPRFFRARCFMILILIHAGFWGSTVQIVECVFKLPFQPGTPAGGGQIQSPIGLEHLVADRDLLFMNVHCDGSGAHRDLGLLATATCLVAWRAMH